ncbi:MAG: DUF4870 domain-containing protein [Oscillospiraceae bacterium]
MDPNNFTNTPDSISQFDPADIQSNKVMAVLSYFGFLFLIPLLAAKDSRFAKFHVNQGLVLFVVEVILGIVQGIFGLFYIPVISTIISVALWVVSILLFVFAILGIVNAAQGKAKALPIIGGITLLK